MKEFNEALDSALNEVEQTNRAGEDPSHMFDVLTCFNTAINATLVRDCGGVRQRRQAKYLTKPVRSLQLDIRAKTKSLHAAQDFIKTHQSKGAS